MRKIIILAGSIALIIILIIVIRSRHSEVIAIKEQPISVVVGKEEKSCPFCTGNPEKPSTSTVSNATISDEAKTPAVRAAINSFIDKTKYALKLESVNCDKSLCTAQISTTMVIDDHGMPFYQSLMFKDFLEPAHVSSLEASTKVMEGGMKNYEITLHISEAV